MDDIAGNEKISGEYETFTDKTRDGREIELAVIDEFECERKLYVASALVENDEINEERVFIYRLRLKGEDDYSIDRITDQKEYERVAKAYMALIDT